eukprot:TRINITY_DN16728_c0_g1_i1.p2 TRINITY_DN16728_c0_g1~~TRINITY_DN16728_c0_g1_i1.p2  ORF type:complete len:343 (-),score=116.32 TRINITY_DN16728_c0_g1_i1:39-1067(-)
MSSLTVLGLGNPLLDISVKADAALFEKYSIKAGTATLAEEKDKPLYDEIKAFPDVSYIAGGATQNSIRGFAWANPISGKAHYIGCVGDDENAQLLKSSAEAAGVKTHYNVSKKNPTGRCAVLVNAEKERSLIADLAAANDYDPEHYKSEEIQTLIKEVDIFYSSGFFLTVSPATVVEVGKHALENNKILAVNLAAVFVVQFFWDALNSVLPYADYVLCNEDEAAAFAEKSGWDASDLSAVAAKISALPKLNEKRERVVVFTQGSKPTIVAKNGETQSYPVAPIDSEKIVDTNGAGDAFVGGFLAALALGKPIDVCVATGNQAGGIIIQQEGSSYPVPCEITL